MPNAMPFEPPPRPDVLRAIGESLGDAVSKLLPSADAPDIRARIDAAIESVLGRLDLVPREAYEAELAALRRLEAALARLEARLAALESAQSPGRDATG
jgi:BMFP domain-containing protein YqiC